MVQGQIELVLGGARSGKSGYAEQQAKLLHCEVIYIATAQVQDDEMAQRVTHHQQQRSDSWLVIEEPCQLPEVLLQYSQPNNCIVVDCLTLWLSNCLFEFPDLNWAERKQALLKCLPQLPGQVILVSNEVGCGIVPMGEETRRFVDEAGWLHQVIAAQVDKVTLVTAGLPLQLKNEVRK